MSSIALFLVLTLIIIIFVIRTDIAVQKRDILRCSLFFSLLDLNGSVAPKAARQLILILVRQINGAPIS